MSEKIFKKKDKPEELTRAKRLIDEFKLDEADLLISNFEEREGHTLHDLVLCHLLKCELLYWRGLNQDVVKLAEQTYKESLGLGKNLLSVDILLRMADSLNWLDQSDKSHDIIKQGEELLKTLPQELPAEYKQREAYIDWLKGWFYIRKKDADRALKHLEYSLSLREELGIKQEIASSLLGISFLFVFLKVDYDRALNYAERGKTIAEESGNKFLIGVSLMRMGTILFSRGELDRSIKYYEQSLTIFNDLSIKSLVAIILNIMGEVYRQKGKLNRALECSEQSIALNLELGNLKEIANNYDYLIQILIEKGDLERAQQILHDLERLNSQLKDKEFYSWYLLNNALILKKSSRTRNKAEAEKILKQILDNEDSDFDLILKALTNLCELLLTELRMTNDLEVLEEINPLIARLLEIAEKSHSYLILCETYLLQAKLSLLTFDIKQAQRFITQAQQIAERFGLTLLAKKIATENEDLLKKIDLWEKLKESGAPMSDRLELARLDEQIEGIIYTRNVLTPQVREEKVVISKEKKICLVCRGEVIGFSYACKCGANYCENCARALTNLENLCWACETPIDYSKPSKPYKKEETIVEIGEKSKKK